MQEIDLNPTATLDCHHELVSGSTVPQTLALVEKWIPKKHAPAQAGVRHDTVANCKRQGTRHKAPGTLFPRETAWSATLFLLLALLAVLLAPPARAQDAPFQLTVKEVEGAVSRELEAQGAGESVTATLVGRYDDVLLTHRNPLTLELDQFTFDKTTRRWSGTLLISDSAQPLAPMNLTGRLDEIVQVPVLRQRMTSADTVSEDDIEYQSLPFSRLRKDTITDSASLIGLMPRRIISASRPIRAEELIQPPVISKDDVVVMRFENANMTITAAGIAQDSGAEGDLIRVKNTDSNAVITARIKGPGEVTVGTPDTPGFQKPARAPARHAESASAPAAEKDL